MKYKKTRKRCLAAVRQMCLRPYTGGAEAFIAAALSLAAFAGDAYADIASGTSGTCSWVIDDAGTLTIRPTDGVSGTLASNENGS